MHASKRERQFPCERGVDGGKEILAIFYLYRQYKKVLGLLCYTRLEVACAHGDGDVSVESTVYLVHHTPEDNAMWRGVFQTCVGDGVVYHLVNEHIVYLLLR